MTTLTQQSIVDLIQVDANSVIHVRQANQILTDGVVTHEAYHRSTLAPGQDTTGQDPRVIAVATALWTPAVVSAYQAMIASQAISA